MNSGSENSSGVSIGALAQATGIAVETLRTWERRYGLANHVPRPSGAQRRYHHAEVRRLRLVRRALGAGHRAAAVVRLPVEQLEELLELSSEAELSGSVDDGGEWLPMVEQWNWSGLGAALTRAASETSAAEFLDSKLGPFLVELGLAWERGQISVGQEHLASECVSEFLSRRWSGLSSANTGPVVLLTTLPAERHVLGLHMAAWALAICGARLVFLGADTPVLEISTAAQKVGAECLVLSGSSASVPGDVLGQLRVVLSELPTSFQVVLGGAAFQRERVPVPEPGPSVTVLKSFVGLQALYRSTHGRSLSRPRSL